LPTGDLECCKHLLESKPQNSCSSDYEFDSSTKVEAIDRSKKIKEKVKSRVVSTISRVVATMPTDASNLREISIDDGQQNILAKMIVGGQNG
jgi:hypothetical protein